MNQLIHQGGSSCPGHGLVAPRGDHSAPGDGSAGKGNGKDGNGGNLSPGFAYVRKP